MQNIIFCEVRYKVGCKSGLKLTSCTSCNVTLYGLNLTSHTLFWVRSKTSKSGADPEFLVGGGANPPGGGANLRFCQKIPKNCMKLRTFWAVRGAPPLDPPLEVANEA